MRSSALAFAIAVLTACATLSTANSSDCEFSGPLDTTAEAQFKHFAVIADAFEADLETCSASNATEDESCSAAHGRYRAQTCFLDKPDKRPFGETSGATIYTWPRSDGKRGGESPKEIRVCKSLAELYQCLDNFSLVGVQDDDKDETVVTAAKECKRIRNKVCDGLGNRRLHDFEFVRKLMKKLAGFMETPESMETDETLKEQLDAYWMAGCYNASQCMNISLADLRTVLDNYNSTTAILNHSSASANPNNSNNSTQDISSATIVNDWGAQTHLGNATNATNDENKSPWWMAILLFALVLLVMTAFICCSVYGCRRHFYGTGTYRMVD